jgi:glutaredoxin 3
MVKVFTTPACPRCFVLKQFLEEHNIDFKEIDVSQDKKALQELKEKTGKMEVPVLDINGEIVVGFDKNKIVELLGISE